MILENEVRRWIGLSLENSVISPFFNKGLTSENFNLSGNTPVDIILLKIYVSRDKTWGALIF